MKKLLIMSIAVFVFSNPVAFAESGGAKGGKGKLFENADANGDGTISESEFKNHHEQKMSEWFGKLDKDGNGEVTPEEAKAGREKMREGMKDRIKDRMKEKRGKKSDAAEAAE